MPDTRPHDPPRSEKVRRQPSHGATTGPGILIVAVYGLLALAATGRSILQISEYFSRAPVSYVLSALAAAIYVVATWGLARGTASSLRVARAAILVELVGVLAVGLVSYLSPQAFPDKTVWSHFGAGYGYVPLVLPLVGLWWVARSLVRERSRARG